MDTEVNGTRWETCRKEGDGWGWFLGGLVVFPRILVSVRTASSSTKKVKTRVDCAGARRRRVQVCSRGLRGVGAAACGVTRAACLQDEQKAEDELAKKRAAFLLKQQRKAEEARVRKQQLEAEVELKRDEAR